MREIMEYKRQVYVAVAVFLITCICLIGYKVIKTYDEAPKLTEEQQEIIDMMTKMS